MSRGTTIEANVLVGDILPTALGVAANAFAVIAVIVVLLTKDGALNGVMFLVGWIGGLAFLIAVVHALVGFTTAVTAGNPAVALAEALLTVGLGVLLLFMGIQEWRKRPRGGQSEPLPKWLVVADEKVSEGRVVTPNRSAALAFTLSALNPKALALVMAASVAVTKSTASFIDTALDFVVFLAIASIAVAIPVIYRMLGGDSAEARLVGWKDWVLEHRSEVTAGVMLLLGLMFVGKGLASLLGVA